MATLRIGATPFSSSPFSQSLSSDATIKPKKKKLVLVSKFNPPTSTDASSAQQWRPTRRLVSFSVLFLPSFLLVPDHAVAGSFLDRYVKRKRLDPLEAYVPAVILTQLQIEDLGKTLEADQPQFADCRSLLRSGPAASLRVNIRAVAQYASEAGNGNSAFNDVDQCLRALEELDSLLLHASRNEPDVSVKSMKSQIGVALDALDSLLQTVPSDVLDKGKAIADAYRAPAENEELETSDPELKQLESIL